MKKKKAIVVQRYIEILNFVREDMEEISKKEAEKILFTQDPGEVLENVKHGEPILVVSGQIFAEAGNHSRIWYGTDLVWKVKKINPNALFFMYSFEPGFDFLMDGMIPKDPNILTSDGKPLLPAILLAYRPGMTEEELRKMFPEII